MGNTGYRRFLASPVGDGFAIDPAKVEADAQFDGVVVLRTSLSMSALAVVLSYRNLLMVELSFLAAKASLATRPVVHRTDATIRRFWLVLRKELLDRLAACGGAVPEWQCVRGCLSTGFFRRCRQTRQVFLQTDDVVPKNLVH